MAKRITIFSWGYYGWGPHTKEILRLTAAVEKVRGYKPPLFVDIRLRRSGRAEGFKGPAFETLAGSRYDWMPDLGNDSIRTKKNSQVIRRPEAAADLLDTAIASAKRKQRVIFFCGCEFACDCHRSKVAALLIREARRRGVAAEVTEWPGGQPTAQPLTVELDPKAFQLLRKSSVAAYLPKSATLEKLAGLPTGAIIRATDGNESMELAAWYAQPNGDGWCLPILWDDKDPVAPKLTAIAKCRKAYGCNAQRA